MPLGSRELLLMVRARDLASGTFQSIGRNMQMMGTQSSLAASKMLGASAALTTAGSTLALAGAAGLGFLNSSIDAAIEYRRLTSQTLTQVDGLKTSVEELGEIGLRIAKVIPVPLEELQQTLFFIFSSMDVSVAQAETLLAGFAREAVAGQSDVQSAARSTIAIMNALGYGVEELDRIQDVQFQTVRKGVITYKELASSIGRVLPAAQRSGQQIETVGAMMAFLTRNGLSAEMASTSAARALESFAHPRVVERLEGMGVAVRGVNGEYRPLVDVMRDLSGQLNNLPGPERTKVLQELFQGAGGTIQARRFWDTALKNFDEFEQHVNWQLGAAGAMGNAYDIMFNQPQSQIELMRNKYQAMKVELGEGLIPIKLRLVEMVGKLIDAWNGLSPGMQDMIVKFIAISSVIAIVVGGVMTIVGAFAGLVAIIMLAGASFGTAIAIITGIPIVLALIGAAVFLVIKHWDTLKSVTLAVWNAITSAISKAWALIKSGTSAAVSFIVDTYRSMSDGVSSAWNAILSGASSAWQTLVDIVSTVTTTVVETVTSFVDMVISGLQSFVDWFINLHAVQAAWETLGVAFESVKLIIEEVILTVQWVIETFVGVAVGLFDLFTMSLSFAGGQASFVFEVIRAGLEILHGYWTMVWNDFMILVTAAWGVIGPVVSAAVAILVTTLRTGMDIMLNVWSIAWAAIRAVITVVVGVIQSIFSGFTVFATQMFTVFWNFMTERARITWDLIMGLIQGALKIISGVIQTVLSAIRGDWQGAWEGIKRILEGVWQIIKTVVQTGIDSVRNVIEAVLGTIKAIWNGGWETVKSFVTTAWDGIVSAISNAIGRVREMMVQLPRSILGWLGNVGSILFNAGKQVIQGFIDGIGSMFGAVAGKLGQLTGALTSWKGPPARDRKLLLGNGKLVMQGFQEGLASEFGNTKKLLNSFTGELSAGTSASIDPVGSRSAASRSITVTFAPGSIAVSGVEDPERAAELIAEQFEEVIREVVTS